MRTIRTLWTVAYVHLRARFKLTRGDRESGYATETVLVTALLVAAALAVIAVIIAKVSAKADGITL
ncbi:MAG TPA: hypothetical protein VM677_01450 [Actinokineospora sp.]|jgi:hypothetical protein|nr:hypothetical protein [Actinokineospora sp.]